MTPKETSPLTFLIVLAGNVLALAAMEALGARGVLLMVLVALAYQALLRPRAAAWAQCLLYTTVYPLAFMNEMLDGGSPWTMPAVFACTILGLRLHHERGRGKRADLLDWRLPNC